MKLGFPILLGFLVIHLLACEAHGFESDKRQIIAKNIIRNKVGRGRSFSITHFREDTLQNWTDSTFKRPIRYTLEYVFKDSVQRIHKGQGIVLFDPEGNTVLQSQITGQ
ncbi:MAG: hypothetical protein M3342_13805 [Bacteroidota bacterium]|nr:hypothetical protein [Flavisolibacter sp.]MDQ3845068.1 hypothetical protein [Bacteroidota bacterium]